MQFWSDCYTVVSYQALFRQSVYKIPAVYISGAKNVCFCTIRDFGSPTITMDHPELTVSNFMGNSIGPDRVSLSSVGFILWAFVFLMLYVK